MKNIKLLSIICALVICTVQVVAKAEEKISGTDSIFTKSTNATEPIVVPPITFVDVNSGRFGKLEIDLEDAQFYSTAADKLHLIARKFDVQAGTLGSLNISVKGGHIHDFIFDKLDMNTAGDLKFQPGTLLNHRLLQFEQPAQADVKVIVSQNSLNQFLGSPKTLERLSLTANRKANALAGLANLVGIKINQVGLIVNSASVKLVRRNQFKMDFSSKLGLGEMGGLDITGQIIGQLALEDGSLVIVDPHIITGGQEIPPELANLLIKKINLIPAISQKSKDIRFNFTDLKVTAGKQIQLQGTAYVNRLRFGNGERG